MADNVNIIVQDTINDIVVNAAVIVETIDINVQAAVDVVEIIANPNNYVVNINRIIGEQVQSDWTQNDNQAPDYIKNKPTLAAVATSGDYDDLINKPTIPTATSNLTNDGEDGINPFITAADVTAQVNSDWDATSGVAEILNKPTIPTNTSDLVNDGEDGVNPFITLADVPVPTNGLPAGGTAGQILTKVDATDYNATWQENYADWTSVVKHIVKNNGLSGTITKGTAVYVTGSNGTNMLVGRASNASEATSSKTMGLMQSDITTTGSNQTGFVITEGLLEGLNTAGHVAGEPVWLGVDGALIYGLANKPYAPAHLVFIGIVTKVSAGNGEIFVKVQNGFELKEIHDVDIITTTPINGHLLGFDGTLWVNKTIATWLGYTPVTDARTISTTAPLSGGGDLTANRTLSITQATTSTDGYLSSTNWNTFNNKFTLPTLTSGSVLFSNGSTIAQDNANLFWDDTNNRLGIGTNAPTLPLDVNGQARIVGTLNLGTTGTVGSISLNRTTDGTTVGGIRADSAGTQIGGFGYSSNILLNNGTTGTSGILFTTGGERMRLFGATGNLAINTTTDAGFKLDVNGTARVKGTGTTSATTAFVVQDSAGANTFQVRDDGQFGKITPTSSGIFNIAGSSSSSAAALFQNGAANFNGFRVQMNAQTLIDEAGVNAFVTTSAILELKATTKGFLPPRMTTTQKNAIATPAAGLVVYDTTLGKLCVRGAAAWETITSI